MPINAGPFKGKLIEPGQAALTRVLSKDAYFGAPKKIKYADRYAELKNKQGIISFMQIPGYSIDGALSRHIDLVRNGKFCICGTRLIAGARVTGTRRNFFFGH